MLLTTASVFGLSTLIYRYVDVYTTSLSRYAGRKFDALLPERGVWISGADGTRETSRTFKSLKQVEEPDRISDEDSPSLTRSKAHGI
jgi:hypothetical protein